MRIFDVFYVFTKRFSGSFPPSSTPYLLWIKWITLWITHFLWKNPHFMLWITLWIVDNLNSYFCPFHIHSTVFLCIFNKIRFFALIHHLFYSPYPQWCLYTKKTPDHLSGVSLFIIHSVINLLYVCSNRYLRCSTYLFQ